MVMLLVLLLLLVMVLVWSVRGGASWRYSEIAIEEAVLLQVVRFVLVSDFFVLCESVVGLDCILL